MLDTLIEAVPQLAKKGAAGPRVTTWVREQPERVLLSLATDPVGALEDLARERLGRTTFQKVAAIEGNIRDVSGMSLDWSDAVSRAGSPLSVDDFKARLDEYVSRRDRISHSGDVKPGGRATQPINKPFVAGARIAVHGVGGAVDAQMSRWIRTR